ncbi:hypothetical protein EC991_011465 [Linnemannia zychae]|nr:hypothetical protein EC991_011465 [Linnemannia zychae]
MAPKSIPSSNPSSDSTSSNSNTTTTVTTISSGSSFHSRHGSTISVLSVPLLDPFYKDLVALKTDHAALYSELKRTQQTLQLSYHDLMMAQERSKRAETDSGRLKTQMDTILLDIELGARRVLEEEHSHLQHELIRYRLNDSNSKDNGIRSNDNNAVSSQLNSSSPSSLSPVGSIRSATFSLFLGGGSRKSRSNINTGGTSSSSSNIDKATRTPSIRSIRMTDEIQSMQESPIASAQTPSLLYSHHLLSAPSTPRTTTTTSSNYDSMSTPPSAPTPQQQYGKGSPAAELVVIQDLDQENLTAFQTHVPSLEQLENQRLFYDKLAAENVAMKMEIQDLRYRNKAEKDSIKGYMSLFESLQKKQSSALAVAQAEIALLRATIQEHTIRLESRETLLQTFAATVNSQAIELEILTRDACRERAARAKTEEEMASLLEASLLMLERLFANVDQLVRARLVRVLDPIRQTIHHLEIPGILQEWELCEKGVQCIINDLARSLVQEQEVQERGLMIEGSTEIGGGGGAASSVGSNNNNNSNTGTFVKATGTSSRSSSVFNGNNGLKHRGSISSTHSAMSTFSSDDNSGNNNRNNIEQGEAMIILDNNYSQQVFVWRKITADTFLEECVKSVENLAQERKELQTRIVELTRVIVEQDEARQLKEVAANHAGAKVEEEKEEEGKGQEEKGEKDLTAEKKQKEKDSIEFKAESTAVVVNEDTSDAPTDSLTLENSPCSAETPYKDSSAEITALAPLAGGNSVGQDNHTKYQEQENHLKDLQEFSSPVNTIDGRNKINISAPTVEVKEKEIVDERTRRLEMILQKVLEWSGDHPQAFKEKSLTEKSEASGASAEGFDDDDIMSLGISEAPAALQEQTPLTVMRARIHSAEDGRSTSSSLSSVTLTDGDVSTGPRKDDFKALLQLIRKELAGDILELSANTTSALAGGSVDAFSPDSSVTTSITKAEVTEVVARDLQEPADLESLSPIEQLPPTTELATINETTSTLTIISTDPSASTGDNVAPMQGHKRVQK